MCFWILMMCLLILLIATTPAWPHSREWGYYPSGAVALFLLILLLLWWLAWLPWWGAYPYWWGD